MKLLTKEIEKRLPAPYSTDGKKGDRQVVVRFFTPDSNWTWLVLEGERLGGGDFRFFGLVQGFEEELGYFSLSELQTARGPLGMPIKRDQHCDRKTLAEVAPEYCRRIWG